MSEKLIYTIGTSTRSLEEFLEILRIFKIKNLLDVRSFPNSKRFPHFNRENLEISLPKKGFDYIYLGKELGGFRKGGYEDHMNKEFFKKGIDMLEEIATKSLSLFFCAEKIFLKCHRRFIAEALAQRGWRVIHIIEKDKTYEHKIQNSQQKTLNF